MKNNRLLLVFVWAPVLVLVATLVWITGSTVQAGEEAATRAPAAERRVCLTGIPFCDYTTIQAAVDAADDFDIIKVAAGLYTDVHARQGITQVVYISKTVTIRGGYNILDWTTSNPVLQPTILDAQQAGRVLFVTGSINPVIDGLYVTGGDATGLGGGPQAHDGVGGGIDVEFAQATIQNCFIYDNLASHTGWGAGGGVALWMSDSTLARNTIYNNTASTGTHPGFAGEGGGVWSSSGSPSLSENLVWENVGSSIGDGLGGGIYMDSGVPLLENSFVRGNVASLTGFGMGGGIYAGPDCNARMTNTVLTNNVSGAAGGSSGAALTAEASSPRLTHTTIQNNTGGDGSGIFVLAYFHLTSRVSLTNTILASQTIGVELTSDATVSGTAVLTGVLWYNNGANTGGPGIISVTHELTGSPAFAGDGYHLLFGSAAVDEGLDAGVSLDIDGQPRPFGGAPDLGADEFVAITKTVDPILGGTITFTDPQGLTTTVQVPPDAVGQSTLFVLAPLISPTHPLPSGECFAGHAFNLDAFCGVNHFVYLPLVFRDFTSDSAAIAVSRPSPAAPSVAQASDLTPCSPTFQKPVTITIHYSDNDISCTNNEGSLLLYYWTGNGWQDSGTTCIPPSSYGRDLANNWLQVAICHLSEFSIGGH